MNNSFDKVMTLRHFFAAAAIQGMLANGEVCTACAHTHGTYGLDVKAPHSAIVSKAYQIADAMLEEGGEL
jgi:hypothetical protein